jgi:hypothetical protein
MTRRVAEDLVTSYPAEASRQQAAWRTSRPAAERPARAGRDAWPPPPARGEAQEHAAAMARRREEGARRRERERKPPEVRIAERLAFWLPGQRRKGREPSGAEVAAKRAGFLARPPPAPSGGAGRDGRP